MTFCLFCRKHEAKPGYGLCESCFEKIGEIEQEAYVKAHEKGCAELYAYADKLDCLFDDICETEDETAILEFHRKRVACLSECFQKSDKTIFAPKSSKEIDDYLGKCKDVWDLKLSPEEGEKIKQAFTAGNWIIKSGYNDVAMGLVGLISGEEDWDWAWYQFMELGLFGIYDGKALDKGTLMSIVEKHFQSELEQPISVP
jgi:hypothetical protein